MNSVQRVLRALCKETGSPLSKEILRDLARGDLTAILGRKVDVADYSDADAYWRDTSLVDLLRKLELPGDANRKKRMAVQTFFSCERANAVTNSRLRRWLWNFGLTDTELALLPVIEEWRKEVRRVLGPLPSDLTPRFSGGATMSDPGRLTTIPDKITSVPTLYEGSIDLLPLWWETAWGRACRARNIHPAVIDHNSFFTVPKDWEKDRGCAKEASISLSYQLAVDRVMRARLSRAYGVNWDLAQDDHKRLAQSGSVMGHLATIDLSNASNNVTTGLVDLVIPSMWSTLFYSLRAPSMKVEGKLVKLEMFSSMGNGLTFMLETLLFWTLAQALQNLTKVPGLIRVYGDDIIVPTGLAKDLLAALAYFGFEPNKRKTYVTGPFRESCGGDYFRGKPVRAVFLKKLPTEPQHWIALANALWKLPHARAARQECLKHIPSAIRSCQGPESLGDIVVHGPEEYWNVRLRPVKAGPHAEPILVPCYRCYRPVTRSLPWHHWQPSVVLASALTGAESSGVVPREGISGWKLAWVQEPSLGNDDPQPIKLWPWIRIDGYAHRRVRNPV